MSDTMRVPVTDDYLRLGFVANPFATVDETGAQPYWMRLVTRAAANRLLAATLRARRRSAPVLLSMVEEIPEYYYRVAENDFLSRTSDDPCLGMMSLNIPLEMMRLGRIRGTLAELAELVVAVDMPTTLGAWLSKALASPEPGLPEASLVTEDELSEAAAAFAADPHAAVERYFGAPAATLTVAELDAVAHEAYLRQVAQPIDPEKAEEGLEATPGLYEQPLEAAGPVETAPDPDAGIREYLLSLVRTRLSPVLARAIAGYGRYGESLAAQEMKVTKAPRKTLTALLRLMNGRWDTVTVIYDKFDSWSMLDAPTKMGVLTSLTELRWIIGESGVMVIAVLKGESPEVEEQFAAAEQVDWTMPELTPLYNGDMAFSPESVQAWLDAASADGTSPLSADGSELAPLVAASGDDVGAFSAMAEAAFGDAASRGATALDAEAISAGLAARAVEDRR